MSINRTIIQTFPVPELPGYESRLVRLDFPPGVGAPLHNHPVAGNGIVLEGDYISHYEGEEVKHYTAGDAIEDLMGTLHLRAENANKDRPLVVVLTYVIPTADASTLIPPEDIPPEETSTMDTRPWWRKLF